MIFPALWAMAFVGSIAALVFAVYFFKKMMAADEGNERMIEIAEAVRQGAAAYLWQQYKVVGIFFAVMFAIFVFLSFGINVQSKWVPIAFLTGGFFSGFAGFCGMKTATWASSRTAEGARKSLNEGLQVAFRSGAVMGLTVVGLGLIDICLWYAILKWIVPMLGFEPLSLVDITVTMLCFGMGASSQALFARVGGGIFTKAADVGADLVGKVEAGIPEDDPRNPATIADNVGDNVGDVAGMGADLYESYCGSILATAALGVSAFSSGAIVPEGMESSTLQQTALFLPMVIAAFGILLSIGGIFLVRTDENADQGTLLKALARGVDASSVGIGIIALIVSYIAFNGTDHKFVGVSVVIGLAAGWLIGKWTEYATSDEYSPTQKLAGQAETGPATVIIGGIADGMMSVWCPVIVVAIATILSFGFGAGWANLASVDHFAMGLYGVGIAAVGMLSTLGITLATDAYGPIADNAGGNAEMAGLDPEVRKRTDALDSLGNTTAATGKGFAIGSAALTALALLAAYVEEVRVGFERWGDSVYEQVADMEQLPVIAEGKDHAESYYKVQSQYIVEIAATKSEDGEVSYTTHGFLAMPDSVRDYRVKPEWDKILTGNGPAKLTVSTAEELKAAEAAATTPTPADDDAEKSDCAEPAAPVLYTSSVTTGEGDNAKTVEYIHFAGSGATLHPVHGATMKAWMDFYAVNPMNPKVLVGMFIGAMATFVFCAMTMKAVGRAAYGMVEEVRRQFREFPGIMTGEQKPDYATPVELSTKAAQKEMLLPSLLGLITPLATGLLLGVAGVMGLLVGTLTCGFCLAVYMSNAGGAWDNAKKYIEAGAYGGKGTDAHKAAVVGDTVGDPFKDTSGPSLNILIKLMSMVSVVLAGLIVRYSLTALGIF